MIHLHAQKYGDEAEDARRGLHDLARDEFSVVPLDMEWLLAMSLLAETAARLRDSESASVLYRLLEPYARLNVAEPLEGMRGSVARYLGLLADMLER